MRDLTLLVSAAILSLGLVHCAGESAADDGAASEEAELKKAPDKSHELFLGKWASTTQDVPTKGPLPFETNVRSLEFKSERADSSSHVRFRLAIVVRPDCSTCKDETIPEGTYRSIADSADDLTRGKLFTTEGGNTSSREFYEIKGDTLKLRATGLGADNKTVVREFRRVK
jgi:hypothetical protein